MTGQAALGGRAGMASVHACRAGACTAALPLDRGLRRGRGRSLQGSVTAHHPIPTGKYEPSAPGFAAPARRKRDAIIVGGGHNGEANTFTGLAWVSGRA